MWMISDYIAISVAGILLITAIVATTFFLIKNMKRKRMRRESSFNFKNEADSELQRLSLSFRTATDNKISFDGSHCTFDDPTLLHINNSHSHRNLIQNYKYEDLQKATHDFSSTNLIAGAVHRGRLNGEDVAIKRTSTHAISRIELFHLTHQRIINHPNVIRVLGTCVTGGPDSFLVLEYASNGSLKDWIRGGLAIKNQFIASCNRFLNWNQRLKICLDAANAMQFLHNAVNLFHIHLSVGNIFLDDEFNAKIGFLSLENENTEEGYLAPEYMRERVVSPSVDVFAFGVVLMEVLSGRPPPPSRGGGERMSGEIKTVLGLEINAEELREWMDYTLGESYEFEAAVEVVNLAKACVEEDAAARPTAGEIAAKLLNLAEEMLATN